MATAHSTQRYAPKPVTDVPCFECGARADYNHHVIPRAHGGTKTVPLCATCHALVHGRSFPMHHGTRTKRGQDAARAEGCLPGRPRKVTPATLRMAMGSMQMPNVRASEVAKMLGINRTVLYRYINGDGTLKPLGQALLSGTVGRYEVVEPAAAD